MAKEEIVTSRRDSGVAGGGEITAASESAVQARIEVQEASRDAVMGRFGISQPAEGVIVVSLGEKRPFAFIRELMKVATSFGGRPAVAEHTLVEWATDDRFLQQGRKGLVVSVEGCVPGSAGLSHIDALQRGMVNVSRAELAVAHIAYLTATRGKDLFRQHYVMAADGVLHFSPFGLTEYRGVYENGGHECVAACRSWSPGRRVER